jgi:hypothetical protein
MKVWYDACTGKQVRYGVAIAKRLRKKGNEVVLTTRKHPDTVALAKLLGEKFHTVGRYDPTSRMTRLHQSLRRQLLFYKMFKEEPPDVAVSHRSVELCRVAFGLGVPIISTHDAPHAEAINRLTMPLIDVLVVSKAILESHLRTYGTKRVVRFDGVDEVAWIKGFKPQARFDYGKPLVVVRQFETRAAYGEGKIDVYEEIAHKLTSLGRVVFLPRYDRKPRKGLIVPKDFVDSASLVAQADLVVSAGGTISREAALQGTPSIVIPTIGRSYVNDYLSEKGFPLFTVKIRKVFDYARKYLGKKRDVKPLLAKLENPVDVIEKIVEELPDESHN